MSCVDLADDPTIRNLIQCKLCKKDAQQVPLIVGEVKKISFFMHKFKTRYMVCDPWEGTLKIYKSKQNFPMDYHEVIL